FTSAMYPDGGLESTILALNNVFYHWGCVLVPPGFTDPVVGEAGGNPYGTAFPSGSGRPTDAVIAAARYQGRRLTHFTDILTSARLPEREGAPA
ncbi:MAG: wrbA, partial [Actinomycetia bacterium]|nr:wrbA [Actinomycetes bacterium]